MVKDEIAAVQDMPGGDAFADAEAYDALRVLEERRKKRRRSRNIKIGVAAGVVALGVAAFLVGGQLLNPEEDEGPAEPETAIVMRDDFSTSIEASGSLQAATSTTITPDVEGTVQEVMVEEGQHVEAGDVLFTMNSPELDKAVDEASEGVSAAEREVAAAEKSVSSLESSYSKAKKEYTSKQKQADKDKAKARKAGEAAKEKAYNQAIAAIPADATDKEKKELKAAAEEEAQTAYDKAYAAVKITSVPSFDEASWADQIQEAKSGVTTAQGSLESAQRAYSQAVADLDKCTVTTPQAGTIVSMSKDSGSSDDSEATTSLTVKVADVSHMKVSVEVNEIDISSIAEGQRAIVSFSAFPGLELEAKVTNIASAATGAEDGVGDGGIVTFRVDMTIDKPDGRLKPGMTASVRILTQDLQDVLVIPVSAVMEDEDGTYVNVVVNEETYETERRSVKVKAQSSTEAVIKKGLSEDEVVLVSGGGMDAGDDADADSEDYEGDDLGLSDVLDIDEG